MSHPVDREVKVLNNIVTGREGEVLRRSDRSRCDIAGSGWRRCARSAGQVNREVVPEDRRNIAVELRCLPWIYIFPQRSRSYRIVSDH